MKCPRDQASLAAMRHGAVKFYCCEICHGLWFQKTDIKDLPKISEKMNLMEADQKPKTSHRTHLQHALCPVDNKTLMTQRELRGIQVDVCLEHEGIWLDSGELDQLVWTYESGQSTAQTSDKNYTAADFALDALFMSDIASDAVVELPGLLGEATEVAAEVAPEAAGAVIEFIVELMGGLFP